MLVISSHVARGSVGLRASGFALEARGHPVWTLPTVSLPFHPGHGPSTKIIPDTKLFGDFLDDLRKAPWTVELGAVLTGYFANAAQVELANRFISQLKKKHPELIYLCDPVLGDAGGLYIARDTAEAIRDLLLPLADIATPNLYELTWLSGDDEAPPAGLPDAAEMANRLPNTATVVTSAPAFMRGNIASLYCEGNLAVSAEHRRLEGAPSGTGDLFCALFLSHRLGGAEPAKALERAAASTFEIIAHAVRNQSDELLLEECTGSLQRSLAMVSMRSIAPVTRRIKTLR